MRWEGRRESENVEDRRRMGGPVAVGGGFAVLLLAVVIALMGGDPRALLQQVEQQQQGQVGAPDGADQPLDPEEEERGDLQGLCWLTRRRLDRNLQRKQFAVQEADHGPI